MKTFTNPLNKIRIASPCAADWNEMHGDARKRFCGECRLNVYNLSAMTRREAETLLINSEGRLCVRFYRRADGTILTQNCPVGWAKVKQRVSRIATATFSMVIGFFSGFLSFNQLENINKESFKNAFIEAIEDKSEKTDADLPEEQLMPVVGESEFVVEEGQVSFDDSLFNVGRITVGRNQSGLRKTAKKSKKAEWANGRVANVRRLEDEPVEVWIK